LCNYPRSNFFLAGNTTRGILLTSNGLVYALVLVLNRFKLNSLASFILVLYIYISLLIPTFIRGQFVNLNLFLVVIPMFISSMVLPSAMLIVSLLVNLVLVVTLGSIFFGQDPDFMLQNIIFAFVFNIISALFIHLGSSATRRYLAEIESSQQQLKGYNEALEHEQVLLDARVQEHTSELAKALAIAEQQAKEQQLLLQRNEAYQKTIRNLSVPTIPVNGDTIIIPLVGNLDEQRLSAFQEQALHSIERYRAKHVILDITGVPMIDSYVAEGIVQAVAATNLLGAEVMVVGVRPEVAQTIVQLQLPLTSLQTFSSLKSAIQELTLRTQAKPTLIPQASSS
jgi:rsbT co-antagonist protein RsbR